MVTYKATCLKCDRDEEYQAKITEREEKTPFCEKCQMKMKPVFIVNENGGFILLGNGWEKKGGY